MEQIQALGIRSVLFQDDLFTLQPARAASICEGIIQRKIKLHWTIKARIDTIRPGMPEMMKEAGCFNIHFGIESGNDETLHLMNKGFTTKQVRDVVQQVKNAGLSCTGNFMLAYPHETEKEIRHTIEFAQELALNVVQFSITLDVPGTKLFEEAVKAGRRFGNPWSEFVKHPEKTDLIELFSSPYFSRQELFNFIDDAYASVRTLFEFKEKERVADEKGH
jgi:radical SAM superfamily enzyme YgiQ (UPF0313 family)